MSAVWAIAAREIRERRFLIVTAFVVGLLPLAAGLIPSIPLEDAQDARELLGLLLGMAFPTAVALAVGSSIVGRDLAEGRLGFYFTRPISGFGIWAGKFLGGVALLVLAFLLVVGPVMIASGFAGDVLVGGRALPGPLRLAPALLLGALAGAHVASSLYRARSKWIALDLLLAVATILALSWLMSRMLNAGAGETLFHALPWMLGVGAASLVAAGAIQVVVGRAEPLRGRRALSIALWSLLCLLLLGVFGLGRWVLATTPQDVGGVSDGVSAAPRGAGIIFNGAAEGRAGYSPVFVMNGATGAYTRFAADRFTVPAFSPDGRRAVWVAPPSLLAEGKPYVTQAEVVQPASTLAVADFAGEIPVVQELRIGGKLDAFYAFALSADGRALLNCRGSVALVDSVSGAVLAEVATPSAQVGFFLPDGQIRLVEGGPKGPASVVVRDWNPRSGATVERARVAGSGSIKVFGRQADRLLLTADGRELLWLDLAAGTQASVLKVDSSPLGTPLFGSPRLALADGGYAIGLTGEVVILGADGSRRTSFDLATGVRAAVLSEPIPGQLAVGIWSWKESGDGSILVDIATGKIQRELPGLLPAGPRWREASPETGSFASRLFIDNEGSLLELLPDGSRNVIVAGRD